MTVPDLGWVAMAITAALVAGNVIRDIRRRLQARR
jgi:hypothetical protein